MAKDKWKIVKTSGGYGVLKSNAGAKVSKLTIVRPRTTEAPRAGRLRTKTAR
ncbi:hypothetical protein [Microbacterium sp. zg-YB36]|uniref:hypothetical protein n=1 Tax=Microbacterium sp. zg-YB36 TaxID=2969407 RepID=UPI00214C9F87|nr:hypothetical protein [Microbacterium sp. zg-YB36]MDL5352170.1 hypothetical protein [Microbacterium sp. zg-YB36]